MSLVFIIAINLAIGMLPHVDNFALVGGFISGFLLGFVLLMHPQFGYASRKNAPIGYPTYTAKRKLKIYQYVLWIIGVVFLVVGAFEKSLCSRLEKTACQVPEIYKVKILKKANSAWRNWKGELRKICDRAETVAERKNIVVEDIKKEDWESFVDLHSTNEDQVRRDCGRNARKKVKILHTTGRKGCARVAHELEKKVLQVKSIDLCYTWPHT